MAINRNLLVILLFLSTTAFGQAKKNSADILIPRSFPENCKYYLVKPEAKNGFVKVIHKQVCPKNEFFSGIGFTLTKIDCKKRKFMELGYGEDLISNIKLHSSTEWSTIVNGSSRSDLVKFVCKRLWKSKGLLKFQPKPLHAHQILKKLLSNALNQAICGSVL